LRRNGFLATTVTALLLLAAPAAANTYSVTGTEDIACSCAGTACTSIRAALTAAAQTDGPDDILLAAGAYSLTNGALVLNSTVTLSGESARTTLLYAAPSSPHTSRGPRNRPPNGRSLVCWSSDTRLTSGRPWREA
jgi:hypothetical protein